MNYSNINWLADLGRWPLSTLIKYNYMKYRKVLIISDLWYFNCSIKNLGVVVTFKVYYFI